MAAHLIAVTQPVIPGVRTAEDLISYAARVSKARLQDQKNRQNSIITDDAELKEWWEAEQSAIYDANVKLYEEAIARGIAKESARMVLPMSSPTTIYMTGTARSWIHYIDLRASNGTQKEHMDVAIACKDIFKYQFPVTADALNWS